MVMGRFAREFGKQKWVPEVQMGSSPSGKKTNETANLINLLTAKTLQDLGLDMSISAKKQSRATTGTVGRIYGNGVSLSAFSTFVYVFYEQLNNQGQRRR